MASSYTPKIPSGSPGGGAPRAITQTATAGNVLHTATSVTGEYDEVYVWIQNNGSTAREVTIEPGSTSNVIKKTIQPKTGLDLVIPGIRFNAGAIIAAFCAASGTDLVAFVNVNNVAT